MYNESSLALELIAYQNKDSFCEELTEHITNIYADIEHKKYKTNTELINKSEHVQLYAQAIHKRFNINVVLDSPMSEIYEAAIFPFLTDYLPQANMMSNFKPKELANILSGVTLYKHIKKLISERNAYNARIHNKKGHINLKHAKLYGYLSEVKHYLLMNFFVHKENGCTPREICAVTLHEIGHAFSGLEVHHRFTTTNSTIMDIVDKLNNNKVDEAKYTYKTVFTPQDLEKEQLEGTTDNVTDFYGKLAGAYMNKIDSQFTNAKYDETNFENLADSFVTRFNMGQELVSMLHKSNTAHKERMRIFNIIYTIAVINFMFTFILLGPVGVILCVLMLFLLFKPRNEVMTYDFPADRYNRVKNGIVNSLKVTTLPKDLVKTLIEQYEYIDEVIKLTDNFSGVWRKVYSYVLPSLREDEYNIKIQQLIENNLNSALFVKSAQLRSL